jgi:hypothetical protein
MSTGRREISPPKHSETRFTRVPLPPFFTLYYDSAKKWFIRHLRGEATAWEGHDTPVAEG